MGKTCLVYRYLYNTFGETISVSQSRQQRRAPAAAAGSLSLRSAAAPRRALKPPLRPSPQTIGASFAMKKVEANGRTCNLGIWVRRAKPPSPRRPSPPAPHPLRRLAWRRRLAGHGGPGAVRLALELLLPRRPRRHHLL